jgi:ABC-type sugar transport system ATPase subunit
MKIELLNIEKEYQKGIKAVDNVSISADSGDFLVLVGPSGCGKSTILRMISGLEEITSGELLFNSKRMNEVESGKRNIGMVFQNYALYPHLTVYENIAFPLKIQKINKLQIDNRVNEIAELIGMKDYLKRKPKQLSGGQRQRVALGRALVRKPDIFLFDEPLSNLDAKLRVLMRNEIIDLHQKAGTTSVYVTHDQIEAMTMGTKIAVLESGKLQQFGTPFEIYNKPSNIFVAGFMGSPQMNFLNGNIQNGEFFAKHLSIKIPKVQPISNMDVTMGIRPEHIIIDNNEHDFIGQVKYSEYLGHEQLLHISIDDISICVRENENQKYSINDKIGLKMLKDKLHFFDTSGKRI